MLYHRYVNAQYYGHGPITYHAPQVLVNTFVISRSLLNMLAYKYSYPYLDTYVDELGDICHKRKLRK
jgi:hypothetical protein